MRGNAGRTVLSIGIVLVLVLGTALLASAAPKGGQPSAPPGSGPATDVECTGCVDTADLDDGAVTDAKVTDVAAGKITGTLAADAIPGLDAAKVTSGTFDAARIPSLDAAAISTGTFDAARIPSLNASAITAGTFDAARIPSLNASAITAGTFDAARIPDLSADKITSGTFPGARLAAGSVTTSKQDANTTFAFTGDSTSLTAAGGAGLGGATLGIGETSTHTVLVTGHAQLVFGANAGSVNYTLQRSEDGTNWTPTAAPTYTVTNVPGQQVPISLTIADQVTTSTVHYRLWASSTVPAIGDDPVITAVDLGRS